MSRNKRLIILVIGIIVLLCSLAALVYAFWPLEVASETVPLAPTWFAPP